MTIILEIIAALAVLAILLPVLSGAASMVGAWPLLAAIAGGCGIALGVASFSE